MSWKDFEKKKVEHNCTNKKSLRLYLPNLTPLTFWSFRQWIKWGHSFIMCMSNQSQSFRCKTCLVEQKDASLYSNFYFHLPMVQLVSFWIQFFPKVFDVVCGKEWHSLAWINENIWRYTTQNKILAEFYKLKHIQNHLFSATGGLHINLPPTSGVLSTFEVDVSPFSLEALFLFTISPPPLGSVSIFCISLIESLQRITNIKILLLHLRYSLSICRHDSTLFDQIDFRIQSGNIIAL